MLRETAVRVERYEDWEVLLHDINGMRVSEFGLADPAPDGKNEDEELVWDVFTNTWLTRSEWNEEEHARLSRRETPEREHPRQAHHGKPPVTTKPDTR